MSTFHLASMSDPQEGSPSDAGIPFSFFCSLVREISRLEPTKPRTRHRRSQQQFEYPALKIFTKWVQELRRRFNPLPVNTTAICFRMLFPEEDIRRKYNMQETRMTQLLAQCFGVESGIFEKWSLEEASGCLGQELRVVLERSSPDSDGFISPLTIAEVDELLDELASKSGYSHQSLRSKYPKDRSRPRAAIIRSLFRPLSPEDAAVLTQIILKDLRPLMYPLTEFHYTVALTKFDSLSVKLLTKEHAMNVWDPSKMLSRFYRMRSSLDEAAAFADQPSNSQRDIAPTMNVPVAIPKSEKGQGCEHALDFLGDSARVWAETKYDGERAQIHVEIREDNSSHITIFSKSKRDSTHDRHAVHSIIRRALGLDTSTHQREKGKLRIRQNVILDAEMVAFRGDKVDEFWRIRELIENTAHGIRGNRRRLYYPVTYEHESMNSEANEDSSLGLVFFDVIYLDSDSLHHRPYAHRRQIIEDLIQTEPGKAILADRSLIDMSVKDPDKALQKIFSEHIASHQEGLVLKAEDSRYNDYRKPWVKLKKDYTGFGDKVDLVILGASWEKIRGRSLRVPTTTFTTFYIGALEKEYKRNAKFPPKFHAYFTVSYGLTREKLEELNFLIKSSNPIPYSPQASNDLPFGLTVFKGLNPPPTVVLLNPLAVRLFGAGFTKAAKSQHYELRFPRIEHFYRPSERGWEDTVNLENLHKIACASIGRDPSDKDIRDSMNSMWGKPTSPSINSPRKRKARTEYWNEELGKLARKAPRWEKSLCRTVIDLTEDSPVAKKRTYVFCTDSQPLVSKTNVIGFGSPTKTSAVMASPAKAGICSYLTPPRKQTSSQHNRPTSRPKSPRVATLAPPSYLTQLMKQAGSPQKNRQTGCPRSPRVATLTLDASSALPLEGTLAWFPSGGRKCASCKSWRKRIPQQGKLSSLQALLVGCGWMTEGVQGECKARQGIIIIDECDEDSGKWKSKILDMLNEIPRTGVEIAVLGCRSTTI